MKDQNEKSMKKIKPYPIDAHVSKAQGQPGTKGHIVKLVPAGFLMRVNADIYRVAELYYVSFEIPGLHSRVSENVKVMKTYDSMEKTVTGQLVKSYLVEFQFINVHGNTLSNIKKFAMMIGQAA
jgi:hypothetical protein